MRLGFSGLISSACFLVVLLLENGKAFQQRERSLISNFSKGTVKGTFKSVNCKTKTLIADKVLLSQFIYLYF